MKLKILAESGESFMLLIKALFSTCFWPRFLSLMRMPCTPSTPMPRILPLTSPLSSSITTSMRPDTLRVDHSKPLLYPVTTSIIPFAVLYCNLYCNICLSHLLDYEFFEDRSYHFLNQLKNILMQEHNFWCNNLAFLYGSISQVCMPYFILLLSDKIFL